MKIDAKAWFGCKQRVAYKVTTKRKHGDQVADNLLNQNFTPVAANEVRAGDIAYLKTAEGWMYLVIVMDLFSRRIVGWHIDKRMTTDLICKAMIKAVNLRQPPQGLVFHSDRSSQYTSKRFGKLLKGYGLRASMGDVGACWDNAVVERFFGSLKHDWIFNVAQPTRDHMKSDVAAYIKYYSVDRLHTANGEVSPINFETSQKKVYGFAWPVQLYRYKQIELLNRFAALQLECEKVILKFCCEFIHPARVSTLGWCWRKNNIEINWTNLNADRAYKNY